MSQQSEKIQSGKDKFNQFTEEEQREIMAVYIEKSGINPVDDREMDEMYLWYYYTTL
jgi:hypothetical protein